MLISTWTTHALASITSALESNICIRPAHAQKTLLQQIEKCKFFEFCINISSAYTNEHSTTLFYRKIQFVHCLVFTFVITYTIISLLIICNSSCMHFLCKSIDLIYYIDLCAIIFLWSVQSIMFIFFSYFFKAWYYINLLKTC